MSNVCLEPDKILYINPDCPIKILLDYIRTSIGIDPEKEFDLCTTQGELKYITTFEENIYATIVLELYTTYICVLVERNDDGILCKLTPLITRNSGFDISLKLRRYINPSRRFSYELKKKNRKNLDKRSITSRSNKSEI